MSTPPDTHDIGTLAGEVLVFGGVYSNLQALEAVRAYAKTRGVPPERTVCTGDVVGYCAEPTACVELLRDWGAHAIAGNVELNVGEGRQDCGCNFDADSRCDLFSRIWYPYALAHTSPEAVAWMRELPHYLHFEHAGRRVAVVHGAFGATSAFVWRSTPWAVKAESFDATGADVVLAGHAGVPFAHRAEGKLWLNAGALGMPANDGTPRVWCAVLRGDGTPEFVALDYDRRR